MAKRVNILAFDTSSAACSVALQKGSALYQRHEVAPMQQAKRLLPLISELLDESSLKLTDLNAVAYGAGPGSFTGLRIAASTVQALGFAKNMPIVPVSSLATLAMSAHITHQCRAIITVLDARMDEVYWAAFQIQQNIQLEPLVPEETCAPHAVRLPEKLHQVEWYGVGDGFKKYADILTKIIPIQLTAIDSDQLPTAEAVLRLAIPILQKGGWVKPEDAIPDYLR